MAEHAAAYPPSAGGPARHGIRLRIRAAHPDFLDLPWQLPLADWQHHRLVEVIRGLHRHVVLFVDYDGRLYALKELPRRLARREHGLLRRLAEEALPVVEAVGVVERAGDLADVLVTRFLDYSLPYRSLFVHQGPPDASDVRSLHDRLLDALAMLLVRLHVAGFFWGDCSLSNVLFRRDAGALAAYVVDVETGEMHPQLTDGQRTTDLDITEENMAGGLLDLQAELGIVGGPDPIDVAADLRNRYDRLWRELTDVEELTPDERFKVQARVRRLNALGFDVDEIEFVGEDQWERLQLRPIVTEQGHHRRRLHSLTGIQAQENQARSLLNDLANFRAHTERTQRRPVPEQVAAHKWLLEVVEPTLAAIPEDLRGRREPIEVFHEIIEHKWFLSERRGHDVGVEEATASYIDDVLANVPSERHLLPDPGEGWIGYG